MHMLQHNDRISCKISFTFNKEELSTNEKKLLNIIMNTVCTGMKGSSVQISEYKDREGIIHTIEELGSATLEYYEVAQLQNKDTPKEIQEFYTTQKRNRNVKKPDEENLIILELTSDNYSERFLLNPKSIKQTDNSIIFNQNSTTSSNLNKLITMHIKFK